MKVEQKFVVGDNIFDTVDEAEAYLASHQDQMRVDAYTDFLRENGMQRVSGTITSHLLDFIKFEKGELKNNPPVKEETAAEPEVSETTETVEEETQTASKSVFADSDAAAEAVVEEEEDVVEEVPAAVMEQAKPKGKSLFQ